MKTINKKRFLTLFIPPLVIGLSILAGWGICIGAWGFEHNGSVDFVLYFFTGFVITGISLVCIFGVLLLLYVIYNIIQSYVEWLHQK